MPVRSVLYLPVKPGCQQRLADTFAEIDVLGHAMRQAGCLSVEFQVARGDPAAPVLVTALWASPEAYQGWLDNPWRGESAVHLAPWLLDEPGHGAVYDVVLATDGPA